MPAVLVHGVPETSAVWDHLRPLLSRPDVIALQLPGFGTPRPDGFGATKEDYVGWLAAQLFDIGEPVDLVGHDWGGALTVRLVSTRPELVRSWMTDAAAIATADFEWHEFAKIWQTPGAGEDFFVSQLAASPDDLGAVYASFGVPLDRARQLGGWLDRTMADCILDLYRSATDVGPEWAPDFRDIAPPGCVIVPTDDTFLPADGARAGARQAGAHVVELAGLGHWWMLQDPEAGAATIEQFWASLA